MGITKSTGEETPIGPGEQGKLVRVIPEMRLKGQTQGKVEGKGLPGKKGFVHAGFLQWKILKPDPWTGT